MEMGEDEEWLYLGLLHKIALSIWPLCATLYFTAQRTTTTTRRHTLALQSAEQISLYNIIRRGGAQTIYGAHPP